MTDVNRFQAELMKYFLKSQMCVLQTIFKEYIVLFRLNSQILLGLVCWVLWHINLCRLFNAKSIFM